MRQLFHVIIMSMVVCSLSVNVSRADTPAVPCNILGKTRSFEASFAAMDLPVGVEKIHYTEKRVGRTVSLDEPEIHIALGLLNPSTCDTKTIVITKHGGVLTAPSGYQIEPVERVNGIRWNNWATQYHVTTPANYAVVAVQYPYVHENTSTRSVRTATGMHKVVETKRTVIPVFYIPYSDELHIAELLSAGSSYLDDVATKAYDALRASHVRSRAYPDKLVVDAPGIKPEFIGRLQSIEHMDLTEFLLDPQWTVDRVQILIGANQERMATYTCSPASACGPLQFTSGTYKEIRRTYSTAGLIADFIDGARDPVNVTEAAILLNDYNLTALVKAFGDSIAQDARLEEYLAAAYNTGVTRVIGTIRAAKAQKKNDWTEGVSTKKKERLLTETKGYIAKLRYLRDEWRPDGLAMTP